MIGPHKYLELNTSVINLSALIIQELQRNRLVKYDELSATMVSRLGEDAKDVFPYALNFLYLVDRLIYHESPVDAFELNISDLKNSLDSDRTIAISK